MKNDELEELVDFADKVLDLAKQARARDRVARGTRSLRALPAGVVER